MTEGGKPAVSEEARELLKLARELYDAELREATAAYARRVRRILQTDRKATPSSVQTGRNDTVPTFALERA